MIAIFGKRGTLGAFAMACCFSCGSALELGDRVGRQETCPQCGFDLHCCRNCRFYEKAAYNECREPMAERVLEKDKANFCDYFEFSEPSPKSAQGEKNTRQKLEALFKK